LTDQSADQGGDERVVPAVCRRGDPSETGRQRQPSTRSVLRQGFRGQRRRLGLQRGDENPSAHERKLLPAGWCLGATSTGRLRQCRRGNHDAALFRIYSFPGGVLMDFHRRRAEQARPLHSWLTAIAVFLVASGFSRTLLVGSGPAEAVPYATAAATEAGPYAATEAATAAHPHAMGAQATQVPADAKAAVSDGCLTCHKGAVDPHPTPQTIGCVGCHGGNGTATTKDQAHTAKPSHPEMWPTAANPKQSYTLLNRENWDWIRFVNPSDL